MLEASNEKNNGVAGPHTQKFLDKVESYLDEGKKVIISDSAYGNGADNALVRELFRRGIAYKVAAYGGTPPATRWDLRWRRDWNRPFIRRAQRRNC